MMNVPESSDVQLRVEETSAPRAPFFLWVSSLWWDVELQVKGILFFSSNDISDDSFI
jgi:hypothetical protein